MRIAPRPSVPTAVKPAKPAEPAPSTSAPSSDHFSAATLNEGSVETLIAAAATLNTSSDQQRAVLGQRLNVLREEKQGLTAQVHQLQAELSRASGPAADALRTQLATAQSQLDSVDAEIADVTRQLAALDQPKPAQVKLPPELLLKSKPIIG